MNTIKRIELLNTAINELITILQLGLYLLDNEQVERILSNVEEVKNSLNKDLQKEHKEAEEFYKQSALNDYERYLKGYACLLSLILYPEPKEYKIRPCVTCGEIWVRIPKVQCSACDDLPKR